MLDDFHESSKGVGVVGLLLGLLVLAGFCGLGLAVMSGDAGSQGPSLETKVEDQGRIIEQLTGTLESKQDELEEMTKSREVSISLGKATDAVSGKLAVQKKLVVKNQTIVKKLGEELTEIQKNFEMYRNRYRANERALAVGEILDLSETMGEGYKESKVREISPLHLRVMKSSGPEGIPFEKLPLEIQDRFQFSEEEASAFEKKMNAINAKRGAIAAVQKKKMDEKRGAANIVLLVQQIKEKELAIRAKEAYADEQVKLAKDFRREASGFDSSAAIAKANGRISADRGKATQARNKAGLSERRATQAGLDVIKFKKELSELQSQLEAARK